jgi:shikimate kinase
MANRDKHGRFLPGHKLAGPGRPPIPKETAYTEAVKLAAEPEHVAQVIEMLYKAALHGDVRAAGVFLGYTVGKPLEIGLEERLSALETALKVRGS